MEMTIQTGRSAEKETCNWVDIEIDGNRYRIEPTNQGKISINKMEGRNDTGVSSNMAVFPRYANVVEID